MAIRDFGFMFWTGQDWFAHGLCQIKLECGLYTSPAIENMSSISDSKI